MSSLSASLLTTQKRLRNRLNPQSDSTALPTLAGPVSRLWGVITDTDAGPPATVTVQLGGSTTSIIGIRYNAALTPTVGMTVALDRSGDDLTVAYTLA